MNKYEVVTYKDGNYASTFLPNMYNAVKFAYENRNTFSHINLNGERIYDKIIVENGKVAFVSTWGEKLF